jgi:hypothetical protein
MHQILIRLFTFDAQFFRLSAEQNAPCPLVHGAFCAADKRINCASKVNELTFSKKQHGK